MSFQSCILELPEHIERDDAFIDRFEARVERTIAKYGLLNSDEKILIAVSGGKDSTALLYLLHKFGYEVEALTVDAKIGCYSAENLKNIKQFCSELGVKLHVVSFRETFGGSLCYLQDVLKEKGVNLKSCTTCGVLRRHLISVHAKRLGADKIVMGHNIDDECQALLMNFMKNHMEKCSSMGPMTGSVHNKHFVARVKPFYLTQEKDIVKYVRMLGLPAKIAVCPCASEGLRYKMRDLLAEYGKENPKFMDNFMKGFLGMLPQLKSRYGKKGKVSYCESCSEPSGQGVCRACEIVSHFK